MKTLTYSKVRGEQGTALIPALMMASMLAMMGLSLLSAGMSGSRAVSQQSDEHELTSAVESLGTLTAERVWSGYLRVNGGAAGTIETFRDYLTSIAIPDSPGTTPPSAHEGLDMTASVGLTLDTSSPVFGAARVDAVRVVRRDAGEATQLYVTVSASTSRGHGLATPALNRAIQVVYTVEPAAFEGFDYGILTNNVNCVFCHAQIDSVERYFEADASHFGSFDKVKVGALESLMIRNDARPGIGDWDADSLIAGPLYVRGHATNQSGVPIAAWGGQTFRSCAYDTDGNLIQNPASGALMPNPFSPASLPLEAGENLYLQYPTDYALMVDGKLPATFPPPFPDNGGIDPATGSHSSVGAGNHLVDDGEFLAVAEEAEGTISGGILHVSEPGASFPTSADFLTSLGVGNATSLASVTHGNVMLTGTVDDPILIDGTIAIDGDVVINGYVKGAGVIMARGSLYVPTDLRYLDGHQYLPGDMADHPSGPVTFGVAQDGTQNVLGLACGGNMLMGDYLQPMHWMAPDEDDIVTGSSDGAWNFALAEVSLFNRGEWAKTQAFLPGPGQNDDPPSTWTVANPNWAGSDYVPRYYQFGPGDEIPIYNLGSIYFDGATGTWRGGAEVPYDWDATKVTILDPSDTSNALLFDPATGVPIATILSLSPSTGWMSDAMYKAALELFEDARPANTPMLIDALLYTNNAIFGIVQRTGTMRGQMIVNGAIVCPDLGLLAPGFRNGAGAGTSQNVPGSPYAVGLRLNYDVRTKGMLNVKNPYSVAIRRALWSPSANVL